MTDDDLDLVEVVRKRLDPSVEITPHRVALHLREAGHPVGDATVLAVHEALRRDLPKPQPWTVHSERTYAVGQGYELTRLVTMYVGDNHKLRAIVHQGNRREVAHAKVERWDGTQWHEVVHFDGYELPVGPSYVCWPHAGRATNNQADCLEWLNTQADTALTYAKEVLA